MMPLAEMAEAVLRTADGREKTALSTFDRAIAAADGRNAHSLNNRGALRLEWGEWAAALPDFHAALKLEPYYEVARRNRDQALAELSERAAGRRSNQRPRGPRVP